MYRSILFLVSLLLFTCKKDLSSDLSIVNQSVKNPKYAQGFALIQHDEYQILEIKNTFPESRKIYRYALVSKEKATSITLNREDFNSILLTPLESVVVTSTTHIPALELLGVETRLKGFPGTDYISSSRTRARIEQGEIRELGTNEGLNTEVLIEINPDVVVGFSVNGGNKSYETISKSGIPVIYNGDWLEGSPLAKAEWIKFFGILFNKESKADSIFNEIESAYLEASKIAKGVDQKPTVMSGAMYKDVWYLPGGSSPEAHFLKDANVNYLWKDTPGKGSLSLSFETVYNKAKDAEIWISPSNFQSKEALLNSNQHYAEFQPFKSGKIYSFSNVTGKTGGTLYYELGISRPDLVLKDIIKICHPFLLQDYQTTFFKPLD
ncbi:MAG: ABC transporter substrate-binding protein [Bacteroidia bacterium]|nr:ABC transporter substrate-binding protein [Bacteroidia bacterium]